MEKVKLHVQKKLILLSLNHPETQELGFPFRNTSSELFEDLGLFFSGNFKNLGL